MSHARLALLAAALSPTAAAQLVSGPTLIGSPDAASSYPTFLQSVPQDGSPQPAVVGGRAFFVAEWPGIGRELGVTDGTAAGTGPFVDLKPGPGSSSPQITAVFDDWFLGTASHPAGGVEPFYSDGTVAGTVHADLTAGGGYTTSASAGKLGNVGYMLIHSDAIGKHVLWSCTPGTGFQLVDLAPSDLPAGFTGFTASPFTWAEAGGWLWFVAPSSEHGWELWRFDPGGPTLEVIDFVPGPGSSWPDGPFLLGDAVVVHATYQGATRLLRIDGQGAITDLATLGGAGYPAGGWDLATNGDQLFFEIDGDPWATDGTPAGTRMLADLAPPPAGAPYYAIADPVAAGDAFFFYQGSSEVGTSLYRATTAPDAVQLVEQIPMSYPLEANQRLLPIGSGELVAYRRFDPASGVELWVTDGGPPVQATEIGPGVAWMSPVLDPLVDPWYPLTYVPSPWHRVGGHLLVEADDGTTGLEPHALPIAQLGGWVAEPFGPSCGGTRVSSSGTARAGDVLTVAVDGAPLAAARLYFGAKPTLVPLAIGCTLVLDAPTFLAATVTDAQGHAELALPVPPLVGLAGAFQWLVDAGGTPLLSDGLEVVIGP